MKSLCFPKIARNLLLFVWSSCHCGCQLEGSDIKRDGWVPCVIICHFEKTQKKRYLEYDNFSSDQPRYNTTKKNLAYNIALHILSPVLTRVSS